MTTGVAKRSGYLLLTVLFALTLAAANIHSVHATSPSDATVVDLAGDDAHTSGTISLGFSFDFYGTVYTDAYVGTNGSLMFTSPTISWDNETLPTTTFGASILPFWDDLSTDAGIAKSIYYKTTGTAGSRQFVIQWTDMNFCCDTGSPFGSFQVILTEGSNTIKFQYFGLTDDSQAKGDSATIGIQEDYTTANHYSTGTAVLTSPESAIEFTPDGTGGYTDNGHVVPYVAAVLTVDALPIRPSTYSPANGSTDVDSNDTLFSWNSSADADTYYLVVGEEPTLFNSNSYSTTANSIVLSTLNAATTYYWRVANYNGNTFVYSDIHSFTTAAAGENVPDNAGSIGPSGLTDGSVADPTKLLTTPFTFDITDPDSSQEVGYEFVISTSSDPADSVIDYMSGLGEQGTRSFTYGTTNDGHFLKGTANTRLVDGTDYYVLVRAFDDANSGSIFNNVGSPSFTYTATPANDNDGSSSAVEDASPNSGDANNDGFPDSWQPNVSSIMSGVSSDYAVLQTDGVNPGDCSNQSMDVKSEAAIGTSDGAFKYPDGLMNFTVHCNTNGATVKVTEYFYGSFSGTYYLRKYNSVTHAYSTIPGAQIGLTTIGGKQVLKAVYFVTDGGALDEDGTANGTIVDPSGIALADASGVGAPNTGLNPVSMAPAILSSLGGTTLLGLYAARRMRR